MQKNPEQTLCTAHCTSYNAIVFLVSYYNNGSEQLMQNLTNRLSVFYPQLFFLTVKKNYFIIGNLFRFKDEIPSCERFAIICKFNNETVMNPTWADAAEP